MKWHEIFKTGKYPQGTFTEEEIDKLIGRFNSEEAGVPLTIDHAKKGPAYGWVDGLKRIGQKVLATFKDVPLEFQSVIQRGLFKHVSPEIIRNVDGKGDRLRAISFLGAQTPQIKELQAIEFSEDEDVICINFNEKEETMNELEKLKKENADLKGQLEKETKEFSEKENSLNKQLKDLQSAAEGQKHKAKEQEVHLFCENLQKEGKIGGKEYFQREKQMLMSMDDTKIIEFSDADGKVEKLTQFESYKKSLESRPKLFAEGEVVTDTSNKQYDYSKDEQNDPESAKLFAEAEKLSSEKDITIAEACKIVSEKDRR